MSFRVLIVGAAGAFGRRLAERLAATTECELVLAGRTAAKLDALIARLKAHYPACKVEGAVLDKDTVQPDRLRGLNLNVVVDAAGPFQDAEPSLARAAIAAGCTTSTSPTRASSSLASPSSTPTPRPPALSPSPARVRRRPFRTPCSIV